MTEAKVVFRFEILAFANGGLWGNFKATTEERALWIANLLRRKFNRVEIIQIDSKHGRQCLALLQIGSGKDRRNFYCENSQLARMLGQAWASTGKKRIYAVHDLSVALRRECQEAAAGNQRKGGSEWKS